MKQKEEIAKQQRMKENELENMAAKKAKETQQRALEKDKLKKKLAQKKVREDLQRQVCYCHYCVINCKL